MARARVNLVVLATGTGNAAIASCLCGGRKEGETERRQELKFPFLSG